MDLLSSPIPEDPTSGNLLHSTVQPLQSPADHFAGHFWGEKNLGFNVLHHNMKHGQISVKDLQDFIRESASAEEMYAKHMTKLAKVAANCNPLGTFAPLMDVLKVMTEKISSCHMDIVLKLQDIIKDLSKYLEEQKNKHKHSKDTFSGTVDALHNIQTATTSVMKYKEKYNQVCAEEERLKMSGGAQKEIEKAGTKSRKAAEEYKSQVGKHAVARHLFEEKMFDSAQKFQKIEQEHLHHMKSVLDTYILSFENAHVLINQVHQEFRRQINENTVGYLLQQYSEQKGTGTERPMTILFEPYTPGMAGSIPVVENGTSNHENPVDASLPIPPPQQPTKSKKEGSGGLFGGIRRRKAKQRNDVSTNSSSSKDSKDAESIDSPEKEPEYRVDEEGFTIRPETPDHASEKNNFQFSSDSDSDSDSDDASRKKIQVHIKPKEAVTTDSGGSDLETLNAVTKNLTLGSPSPLGMKKLSLAVVENNRSEKSSKEGQKKSEKLSTDELLQLFSNGGTKSPPTVSQDSLSRTSSIDKDNVSEEVTDFFSKAPISKPSKSVKSRNNSIKKGPAPPIPGSIPHSASAKSLDDILAMDDSTDINPDIPPPRPPKPGGPAPPLLPHTRPTDLSVVNAARPANFEPPKSHSAPLASSESWSSLSSAGGAGTPVLSSSESSVPGFSSHSRGPSPLTLSQNDPIPIAIAFTETVNAYFKGVDNTKTLTKVTGDIQISFPAGITRAFTSNPNPPVLSFKVSCPDSKNLTGLSPHDTNLLKKDLFASEASTHAFHFDMPSLLTHVKNMTEKDPNSPHYNIRILSYIVPSSHQTLPLHVTSEWKCEPEMTKIKIDYKHNSSASSAALQSLNVIVPVHGTVTNVQSTPQSKWMAAQNRLCWQIPGRISEASAGCLESTLTMSSGPSKPSALAMQFLSEGNTLSGANFELSGIGYRISLIKKRFLTGKYLCENL
ncbi:F-BAR domain only protein 2-like [Styela clava]